jgi:CYTH domain-containing protein
MSEVIELEISYLAAAIPEGLAECKSVEIEDTYFPAAQRHAKMRIRRKDNTYTLTKKEQIDPNDAGQQREFNLALTLDEYTALRQGDGRTVSKTRYFMPYQGHIAEVDIFGGPLEGLVVIEFEFDSLEEKDAFGMPDFCSADVTQEEFIAGGMIAGKAYADIAADLDRYDYQPLHFQA